ncbi:MAG: DUF5916 domain-containing protein, partial [Gemmatimonadota bacterium]
RNETSSWVPIRRSDAAIVSKFGELQGLTGLGSPTRMELRPFSLARLARAPEENGDPTLDVTLNPDFNFQQFRSTVVLRWEYRAGSLLYLVWSQGRNHDAGDGELNFRNDLEDLFHEDAENVFMVKVSYWITP